MRASVEGFHEDSARRSFSANDNNNESQPQAIQSTVEITRQEKKEFMECW